MNKADETFRHLRCSILKSVVYSYLIGNHSTSATLYVVYEDT